MTAQTDHTIKLKGMEKTFPAMACPALYPLSQIIEPGGVTGLVGPDGAGKTTLLRILAGLLAPSGGTVTVAGLDPIRNAKALRAQLGYMPQRFGLYEDLSVEENLVLYAALRNVTGAERDAAFERLLSFTGLRPFTGRLAGKLSGGMKQKLGLACTLLGTPLVLLLDEPGVGVDPLSRRELWAMVHQLAKEGMLIVWSTSYLDEAEQCHRVLLLNEGQLLYHGPPADLARTMEGRIWLARSRDGGKNRLLLQKAAITPGIWDGSIQGKALRITLEVGLPPAQAAQSLGVAETDLLPATPCFEDAFIDLLGGGPSMASPLARMMDSPPALRADQPVIEARELTKAFGSFLATDHVNFAVGQGEIFGLLGPNGAGKSTTFKMMCGLLKPTGGQALVLGRDLQKQGGKARQQLGYMAQKFSLYGGLSVRQNLDFFAGAYGLEGTLRQARMDSMIEAFAFEPYLENSAGSLPLGYKQRLALACSLMHQPAVLFLDEPTSGVDPLTRREFWLHINSMAAKGVTIMVTTHFMDEAQYCDRIGLVYRGRLIALDSPDRLKALAQTEAMPDPTMEQAFIRLIAAYDSQEEDAA